MVIITCATRPRSSSRHTLAAAAHCSDLNPREDPSPLQPRDGSTRGGELLHLRAFPRSGALSIAVAKPRGFENRPAEETEMGNLVSMLRSDARLQLSDLIDMLALICQAVNHSLCKKPSATCLATKNNERIPVVGRGPSSLLSTFDARLVNPIPIRRDF